MNERQGYGVEGVKGGQPSWRDARPALWFASGFCPCRQRKKTLLLAVNRACPESGTYRGLGGRAECARCFGGDSGGWFLRG